MRSPSLPHARVAEQSYLGGSAVGSPSSRQTNNPMPLPTVSLEQLGDLPVAVRSPEPEQTAPVAEPVPVTVSSPPSQPPPQPPPPLVEEPPTHDELKEEDDTLRFAGGPIPPTNAESAIVFAAPGSVASPPLSPPPTTTQHVASAGTGLNGPTEEIATPLPQQTFTSAPIFSNTSLDTIDSSVTPNSPPPPVHLPANTPSSRYSIAARRPDVGDAPGLSFSRRAKIPAHVAAAAVPLPTPSKSVSAAPLGPDSGTVPTENSAKSTNAVEAPASTSKSDTKGTRKAPASKTPKVQKKEGSKLPSESSVQPPETSTTQTHPATSDPAASTPNVQTPRPSSPALAPSAAPQPAPPVKQPPKSWAALLRPATPAKPAKASQPQVPNATQGNTASTQSGIEATHSKEPKANGHTGVNGTIEPLPTNVPLHVVLADGVKPYSALSQPTQPRGLINSGNMCFANVVLQALVYSAPFVRLFETLSRLVPGNLDGKATLYEAM